MADDQIDLSDEEIEWAIEFDYVDRAIQELARAWPKRRARRELRALLKRRLRRPVSKRLDDPTSNDP
jgi:hypothetical protein